MNIRSFEQEFSEIRQAIFAIVHSLGAALPLTPEVKDALTALAEAERKDAQ